MEAKGSFHLCHSYFPLPSNAAKIHTPTQLRARRCLFISLADLWKAIARQRRGRVFYVFAAYLERSRAMEFFESLLVDVKRVFLVSQNLLRIGIKSSDNIFNIFNIFS